MTSRLFKLLDDVLLRLYYIYEKSPKKSRELADIVENLKEVFEFPKGGCSPLRSHGSRWITHKRKALQRVIDRFGSYLLHLSTLAEDEATKPEDRARFKGYLRKWQYCSVIIGAAMYVDILHSPSLLSLSLQDSTLDIAQGINHIIKSVAQLNDCASRDPLQWPTVKVVLSRITDVDGSTLYQGAHVFNYSPSSIASLSRQALADLTRLKESMLSRLKWSDLNLLKAFLVFIVTQNWQKKESEDMVEMKSAVETINSQFSKPLEIKGFSLTMVYDELDDVVGYARKFLNIERGTKECGISYTLLQMLPGGPIHFSFANWYLVCHFLMAV